MAYSTYSQRRNSVQEMNLDKLRLPKPELSEFQKIFAEAKRRRRLDLEDSIQAKKIAQQMNSYHD
jgi:hypothetical protein